MTEPLYDPLGVLPPGVAGPSPADEPIPDYTPGVPTYFETFWAQAERRAGKGGQPSNLFLPLVLGGLASIAAAPLLYRAVAGKRGKDNAEAVRMVDNASNRAVSLIGAFAPLVALPMTYIAVDELENRRIISGPLGDSVQVLISAMAGGQLVSGLATIAKAI